MYKLGLVHTNSESHTSSTHHANADGLSMDPDVFLEMVIREEAVGRINQCFLGTESWIDHPFVRASDRLKQSFITTKLESTCCTFMGSDHLKCALFESSLPDEISLAARLLTSITGSVPTIVNRNASVLQDGA